MCPQFLNRGSEGVAVRCKIERQAFVRRENGRPRARAHAFLDEPLGRHLCALQVGRRAVQIVEKQHRGSPRCARLRRCRRNALDGRGCMGRRRRGSLQRIARRNRKRGDLARLSLIENFEIALLQPAHGMTARIANHYFQRRR